MDGKLRVIKVLGNGKRRFDPRDKEGLIDACLEPGVSLARLALEHGVNANQLRNWVTLRRRRGEKEQGPGNVAGYETAGFIPVVEATSVMASSPGHGGLVIGREGEPAGPVRQRSSRARLKVSMPNGMRLELDGGDAQLLCAMIAALGRCDVPTGS